MGAGSGYKAKRSLMRKLAAGRGIPLSDNARRVLERRYLRKDRSGSPVESPEELFARVAADVASAEAAYGPTGVAEEYAGRFYEAMARLDFLPNSPTLMNAGRRLQQLAACFVLPVADSIESIFNAVKLAAVIHQSGGGTGFSFSHLRPAGDIVNSSQGLASGPVSFMRVFNAATDAVSQGGFRRGANMAVLRVDHPDIIEFVRAKEDPSELVNFNISVAVTDDYWQALQRDSDYALVNPRTGDEWARISAREVFDVAVASAWASGDPGLVFIDRINEHNPTPQLGPIESTNPCGEQPLLAYEACNLGSVNLSHFAADGSIDYDRLGEVVRLGVRFLDDCVDRCRYPLARISRLAHANRKIGLGVMGFADLLIELGVRYDSDQALKTAEEVADFIQRTAREASAALARERGAFDNFPQSTFARRGLPPLRNATTTTIAPTGTISIIANCSSGIEPLFAVAFERHVLDGETLTDLHPALVRIANQRGFARKAVFAEVARTGRVAGIAKVPAAVAQLFRTAHEIAPEWHVRVQAAFQKHIDNAVSKTVNLPYEADEDAVAGVFRLAYELGCKGITVYRDRSRQHQVLAVAGRDQNRPASRSRSCRVSGSCPDCGAAFTYHGGCAVCTRCGFSRC